MPSPVGHVLAGVAAGWLVANRRTLEPVPDDPPGGAASGAAASGYAGVGHRLRLGRDTLIFAALALLPDIDFLWGMHNMHTHSIGAALLVGLAAAVIARRRRLLFGAAAAAAYGSHILLDWLGDDRTPPIGIMALWPFDDGFYQSEVRLFMGISRRYWAEGFVAHNLTAVAWELLILLPVLGLVWLFRRKSRIRGTKSQIPNPKSSHRQYS